MMAYMSNEDVEKFLAEQKAFEERRQALIAELLKRRERQNREIDEELARLGYRQDAPKPPRSHQKKTAETKGKGEKR